MEAADNQPPKKRKLYESSQPFTEPSIPPPPPPPPPPQPSAQNQEFASSPPTEDDPLPPEEVNRRRRNQQEIMSLFDCYRRFKFCVNSKDARLMPELEQSYLSLITASRGCIYVQRIVAELIPRYASFCPTALEAAAKVSINMYHWNLDLVTRGEDANRISYQTVKACILGLVDICRAASYEAPTSSVIKGICDAVFQIVLTFFVSTFEGKDIYHIGSRKTEALQDPMNFHDALKERPDDENEPALHKLFELRVHCLLCIFISFPKNLLAACFQLIVSATDGHLSKGHYFLKQVTSHFNADKVNYILEKAFDGPSVCKDPREINMENEGLSHVELCSLKSNSCFLGLAINRDSSLRRWIVSMYKKISLSLGSPATLELTSTLDKVLGSLLEIEEADLEESDGTNSVRKAHLQHDQCGNASGDGLSAMDDTAGSDAHGKIDVSDGDFVAQTTKPHQVFHSNDLDLWSPSRNSVHEGEKLVLLKVERRDNHDSHPKKRLGQNDLSDTKKETESLSDGSASGSSCAVKNLSRSSDKTIHTSSQPLWFFNENPKPVDVVYASKELWLSSLGHEASDISVKSQFESFGPLEQFMFVSAKQFALVGYRNILDAAKALEYMQGSALWGGCLSIKFLDKGLGTGQYVNGVSVAESHHVYIHKVSIQQLKDDILHELLKIGLGKPHVVAELTSENGCLLGFGTAEDAALAIRHIRDYLGKSEQHAYPRNNKSAFSVEEHTPRKSTAASQHEPSYAGFSSNLGRPYSVCATGRPDRQIHVPPPPKINIEGYANQGHNVQALYSNSITTRSVDFVNVGSKKINDCGNIVPMDLSDPEEVNSTPHSGERVLHLVKQDSEPRAIGSIPQRPVAAPAGSIIPPPAPMPYIRPAYFTPSNSWNGSGPNLPLNRPAGIIPNNNHNIRPCPVPFIPCSVTPLSQLSGGTIAGLPSVAPPPPALLPRSSPPLPLSQPAPVPPPPSFSHPKPFADSLNLPKAAGSSQYPWQGNLTKSGVHYCAVYASRENSVACKYLNAASEPTDWPARLDVTNRTDFHRVKTSFAKTPCHKREICRLLPLTTNDQKGVHDFSSYLKQRECTGIVKIPAGKYMWARKIFLLPNSPDFCSLVGITHHQVECLIALVLPKESTLE